MKPMPDGPDKDHPIRLGATRREREVVSTAKFVADLAKAAIEAVRAEQQSNLPGIQALPQRMFDGANRYDTDDEIVLSLWADGETWDIRIPKSLTTPKEPKR